MELLLGVVLGGGGARGAAHVGMLKAIQVCKDNKNILKLIEYQ